MRKLLINFDKKLRHDTAPFREGGGQSFFKMKDGSVTTPPQAPRHIN